MTEEEIINEALVEGVLKELLALEDALAISQRRIAFIKTWCKGLGSFTTKGYIVEVDEEFVNVSKKDYIFP